MVSSGESIRYYFSLPKIAEASLYLDYFQIVDVRALAKLIIVANGSNPLDWSD